MSMADVPRVKPRRTSQAESTEAHSHVVQFYRDESFLLDELSRFIGTALRAGSSAVVVATKAHEDNLARRLKEHGIDLVGSIAAGRYLTLDASEALSRFMVEGSPDAARFSELFGSIIARAAAAAIDGNHRVVAFGEMVSLLWSEGKSEAAIQLERLWNQLARAYSFSLRCAYPMQGFCREEHAELLLDICGEHSQVIPDDSYGDLSSEDDRQRSVVRLQHRVQTLEAEVDLHRGEEQFRLLIDSVSDYAIFMLDLEGRVNTWNVGAERIKGYKASEIIGRHFSCFYPHEDVASGKPQRMLELAIKEGHSQDEGWRVRKDGSRFWASVTIAAVRDAKGKLIGFGKVTRDLTERRQSEKALRHSEERFRLMTEAVQDYAIFMLDPEGHVSTWNRGAERLTGYQAAEIIGHGFSCFFSERDVKARKPERALQIAKTEGRLEDEGLRRRKDGSTFMANVILTPVRDETGRLIGFAKVIRDVTDKIHRETSLRNLTSHLLRMQDEERRRIGRDLHDTLGQCVTAMKINLDTLASSLEPESKIGQQVNQCLGLAQECVKEVRTISYLLYPPMLEEMGLKSAIPWYLEGFTARSGIQATFDANADFGRLTRDTELALYRVLQESLTNVHRHSGSQKAHVRLFTEDEKAVLEVQDFGKGIPPSILEESGESWTRVVGVGLRGMKERLAQLGGSLEISSEGCGARVTAVVPISPV